MKVDLPPDTATALLFRLRSLFDGEKGGSIEVLDAGNKVLFRMALQKPCAPDPCEGTMALYAPKEHILPDANGEAAKARIVSDGVYRLGLDVGPIGSGAAVELSKMKVSVDDVIRAKTRLIFNW